jgi:hypothetical protein
MPRKGGRDAAEAAADLRDQMMRGGRPAFGEAKIPPAPPTQQSPRLPADAQARKNIPLCSGLLDYFPDALAAVAELSKKGNDQHNPGEPLHWARGKSTDQADTILRHMLDRGTLDTDKVRHSTKVAWRSLAQLQIEIEEAEGLPISRGSTP